MERKTLVYLSESSYLVEEVGQASFDDGTTRPTRITLCSRSISPPNYAELRQEWEDNGKQGNPPDNKGKFSIQEQQANSRYIRQQLTSCKDIGNLELINGHPAERTQLDDQIFYMLSDIIKS